MTGFYARTLFLFLQLFMLNGITLAFIVSISTAYAQNLVPNPGFETFSQCPDATGQVNRTENWVSFCGSPDYFNSCASPSMLGVPGNFGGYQLAAGGDAYLGFTSWSSISSETREFPACELATPLVVGTKYYVSFKVALSLDPLYNPANCASNKLGVKFTIGDRECSSLITNNSQVVSNSIVSDSSSWTRVFGSFTADSTYNYLVIGNFFDNSNTDTLEYFDSWWSDFAYYYLDDVCVSTDSVYTTTYGYLGLANDVFRDNRCYVSQASDQLVIENNSGAGIDVEGYNLLGDRIFSILDVGETSLTIDLKKVPSGHFLVLIRSNQQIMVQEFLKP